MKLLSIALASTAFGLAGGGAVAYVTGFHKSSDWDVILVGATTASLFLWVIGALILGSRKQKKAYLIFGSLSPLIGLPLAAYLAAIVEEGFGQAFSNLTSVLVWSPVFVGVGILLVPFGILMGWVAGSIMAPSSHKPAPDLQP